MKPAMVISKSDTCSELTPRKVGNTPSITQGCRPYSATSHPSSAAIQGNGSDQNATRSSQRGGRRCTEQR